MREYIVVAMCIFTISCAQQKSSLATKATAFDSVRIFVFGNDTSKNSILSSGFGYDIYVHGQLYIHQPGIPAISANKGFQTVNAAQKTADLVASKIRKNILPPSLSIPELDSLGLLGN